MGALATILVLAAFGMFVGATHTEGFWKGVFGIAGLICFGLAVICLLVAASKDR